MCDLQRCAITQLRESEVTHTINQQEQDTLRHSGGVHRGQLATLFVELDAMCLAVPGLKMSAPAVLETPCACAVLHYSPRCLCTTIGCKSIQLQAHVQSQRSAVH